MELVNKADCMGKDRIDKGLLIMKKLYSFVLKPFTES